MRPAAAVCPSLVPVHGTPRTRSARARSIVRVQTPAALIEQERAKPPSCNRSKQGWLGLVATRNRAIQEPCAPQWWALRRTSAMIVSCGLIRFDVGNRLASATARPW